MHPAYLDIVDSIKQYQIWTLLGWNDIKRRYRRSVAGPIWTALGIALFIVILGPLYANIFNVPLDLYWPHLAIGMVIWNFISNSMIESCKAFTDAAGYISSINLPKYLFLLRVIWRNFIVLLYQFIVVIIVFVILQKPISSNVIIAIPGLVILIINLLGICLILGIIATRYRDIYELISAILRVVFFATPIIWMPEFSNRYNWVANWNPMYHYIELIRTPVISDGIPSTSLLVSTAIAMGTGILGFFLFKRHRSSIPFWI